MRTRWWALTVALLMAAALTLTACGGGGEDDSGPAGGETPLATEDAEDSEDGGSSVGAVCELVTVQEAAGVLGEEVETAEAGSSGPYDSCTYNVKSVALKFAIVQLRTDIDKGDFEDEIESSAGFLEAEAIPVSGVGDSAYSMGDFLYVHQGKFELVITVLLGLSFDEPGTAEKVLDAERVLAEKALGRLP